MLRLLTGAFPHQHLTDENVEAYLARMTSSPFDDVGTLLAVAEATVDTLDRLPTLHQLLVAYQAAARAAIADARARDQRALDRSGAARGRLPGMDGQLGAAMTRVLRQALGEGLATVGGDDGRGHRHVRGIDPATGVVDGEGHLIGRCPVCAYGDDIAATMARRVGELMAEHHVTAVPQPVQLRQCQRCDLTMPGFVVADDEPAGFSVRPCPECQPDAYERWAAGGLEARRGVLR